MTWTVKRTDTFLESLRAIRKDIRSLKELNKKIRRLQEDPLHVGGWLSGELHGKKSTRISKRYRLIFTPIENEKVVYLNWLDHREYVYQEINLTTPKITEGAEVAGMSKRKFMAMIEDFGIPFNISEHDLVKGFRFLSELRGYNVRGK